MHPQKKDQTCFPVSGTSRGGHPNGITRSNGTRPRSHQPMLSSSPPRPSSRQPTAPSTASLPCGASARPSLRRPPSLHRHSRTRRSRVRCATPPLTLHLVRPGGRCAPRVRSYAACDRHVRYRYRESNFLGDYRASRTLPSSVARAVGVGLCWLSHTHTRRPILADTREQTRDRSRHMRVVSSLSVCSMTV